MASAINKNLMITIEALYDAVTDQRKWERVLREMCLLLEGDAAHLGHFDHENPLFNVSLLWTDSQDKCYWDAEIQQKFERLMPEDPRLILCNRYPEKPISCRMYLTDDQLHASKMWQEVLQYSKAEYSLIVTLLGSNNKTLTGIGVFRNPGKVPFDQEECDLMGELVPHFKRAFTLHKQLASMDMNQRMAMSALDHIPMGLFVVTGEGKIRFSNDSGQELLNQNDGLSNRSGYLSLKMANEDRTFHRYLGSAVKTFSQGTSPTPSQTFSVTRRKVAEPLWAMISPLASSNLPLGVGITDQPMAVVFISDPRKPQETPPELLQRLFGFTRREAEVVEQLVSGQSLQESAKILDISEQTARSHLKSAFGKTQTTRQSDLVRMVLSSPVWIRKTTTPSDPKTNIEDTLKHGTQFRLFSP
ncbi:MAG: hypothetical protein HQL75_06760 [Magnetococcales bacterium]|nr:hypothetical protein [Magnetococcales bacterium]